MRFLLCGINAKYIHSNLAIFSLKAYADRKKIPGAEIILKEYTINNYVEDILQDSQISPRSLMLKFLTSAVAAEQILRSGLIDVEMAT